MRSCLTLNTVEITKKFHITRQTINNWEKYGGLKTKRTPTNRLIWDEESIRWLQNYIDRRQENRIKKKMDKKIEIQNRRYLGAKTRLLDFIDQVVSKHTNNVTSIADIFAGTGIVSKHFMDQDMEIYVNDLLDSNYLCYQAFLGIDPVDDNKVLNAISSMNELQADGDNYVSLNYGNKYFSVENARKIGEAREFIEAGNFKTRERAILLTSLIYAMDKVANTVGHYDAYRKKMDTIAPIEFKLPNYNKQFDKRVHLFHEDANQLVKSISADLVYIDPPYNSRQYGDVYHVLENIVDWKKPELFGIAMKPKDRSKTKSRYSTSKAPEAFDSLIQSIDSRYILVSYNNMAQKGAGRSNAKISNEEIIHSLSKRGKVSVFSEDFKVFTTGKTNISGHKEILYLVEVKND